MSAEVPSSPEQHETERHELSVAPEFDLSQLSGPQIERLIHELHIDLNLDQPFFPETRRALNSLDFAVSRALDTLALSGREDVLEVFTYLVHTEQEGWVRNVVSDRMDTLLRGQLESAEKRERVFALMRELAEPGGTSEEEGVMFAVARAVESDWLDLPTRRWLFFNLLSEITDTPTSVAYEPPEA